MKIDKMVFKVTFVAINSVVLEWKYSVFRRV